MKNLHVLKKILKSNNINFDAKNINNIEIAFLDLSGNLKEIVIPKSELETALKNGVKCDGSSIGFCDVTNSDLLVTLDKYSAYILPNKNLFIISNTNHKSDYRKNLIETEKTNFNKNTKIYFGIELEFFLFKNNCLDKLNYYEVENNIEFLCMSDIMNFCEKINFSISAFHHECGHSQYEINFKYNISHKTADNLVFLKKIITYFAEKYNLQVSFLPKPFESECGSGMHTNISIFYKNKNLFYDKNSELKLSKLASDFAGGIINHLKSISAISNPIPNSYDRLKLGSETPSEIKICSNNRNSLIRVPTANKISTRIEFRLPDPSANPYLLFNAIIICGLDKSKYKILNNNIPDSIEEAKNALKKDLLLSSIIPKKF